MKSVFQENKKVIYFLLRFLLSFAGFSLLYAYWIESYGNQPDPFSWLIGQQLVYLYGAENLVIERISGHPAIGVFYHGTNAISLYEGCNGIAVAILFFSFIFAFKGNWMDLLWFTPIGFLVIHGFNLMRLSLLIHLAQNNSDLFHFMHKYLFTLIIYVAVFALWVIWVRLALKRTRNAKVTA